MKIPEPYYSYGARIDRYHEELEREKRVHLGVSEVGEPCLRRLWYKYHMSIDEDFSGRILRLFRRGQNEEGVVISDLQAIGHEITDMQARVDFGHNFRGSVDGVLDGRYVLEIKTHSQKSFDDLVKSGVEKSQPKHWAQCQLYPYGLGLEKTLYFAVNKNTDEIYTQVIKVEKSLCEELIRKAHDIILSPIPMPKIADDKNSWWCQFCPAKDLCHGA